MTITIERVFELSENNIKHLANKWSCEIDEVRDFIESGDFDIEDLHFCAFDEYHDYSTITIK